MKRHFLPKTLTAAAVLLLTGFLPIALHAQEGDGQSINGAISLSMVPKDATIAPPQMQQSSSSIAYPDSLLQQKREGSVEVDALIGADGKVSKINVVNSTGEPFTTLALTGVRGFNFKPAERDGSPVEAWMTIKVGFKIQDKWATAYDKRTDSKEEDKPDKWAFVADVAPPKMDSKMFNKLLVYPSVARENSVEGTVTIKALVNVNGEVLKVERQGDGDSLLAEAAMDAIRKTRFTPGMEEGKPKEMWATVPVSFTIGNVGSKDAEPADGGKTGELKEPTYDPNELRENLEYFVEQSSDDVIQARVLIDESGSVKQVLVPDDADLLLSTAAVQAIKRTKFTAGTQGGVPISVWISIPIDFSSEKE